MLDSVKNKLWQRTPRSFLYKGICFLCTVFLSLGVFANPEGGQVTSGNATISNPNSNTVIINQGSDKAIINWQSFNINSNETTHFQQPVNGMALNRISPLQGGSQIYGRLTATGQIILVNPAGIYFGPGAYINVGGLIASTANITDQNFLNSLYHFDHVDGYAGSIINEGLIIAADHGLVALVGNGVSNTGVIQANLGSVILASGNAFTMSFASQDLINFSVDAPATSAGVDQNGKPLTNGVSNKGTLIANGGKVLVSAKTVKNVLDHAINMEGIVEAKSVTQRNGEIILDGGEQGSVRVSAKLDASGKGSNQTGGKVKILGSNVSVVDQSSIDVSGDAGGGVVLIGGDYQGKNTEIRNSEHTFVGSDSNIYADALTSGNGGKVIVWADNDTSFYGNIFARGGFSGGNGGFAEVSGKESLDYNGVVNTTAPLGTIGTLLLDPKFLIIQATGAVLIVMALITYLLIMLQVQILLHRQVLLLQLVQSFCKQALM